MHTFELAAIINSYNRRPLLGHALPSLASALEKLPISSAIIVFDAGSTDGSREYVVEYARHVSATPVILVTPGLGQGSSFADGCNQGCAKAFEQFPELKWLLFFETDNRLASVYPLHEAIRLLEEQSALAGVGFTVETLEGAKGGYGCRFPNVFHFVVGQRLAGKLRLEEPKTGHWIGTGSGLRWQFCDSVFTSPLLLRARAWHDAGPMDNRRFPFTDSDVDLCWTMHKKGWKFAVLDVPGVVHDNARAPSEWSRSRVLYFHQSRLRLLAKHRGQWIKVIILPLLLVRHLLEVALLALAALFSPRAKASMATRVTLIRKVFNGYE